MLKVQFALWAPTALYGLPEVVIADHDFGWLPVQAAGQYTTAFIDDWLARPRLTCCDFQGGLLLDIDGVRWNGTGFDEFWMTVSWYWALTQLWHGATEAQAHPWEEGHLILQRAGDRLTMFETRHTPDFCYPVTVDWADGVQQVAAHGQVYAQWARGVRASVEQRFPTIPLPTHIDAAFTLDEKAAKILQEINLRDIEAIEAFVALVGV
jgi:hypothetical protein